MGGSPWESVGAPAKINLNLAYQAPDPEAPPADCGSSVAVEVTRLQEKRVILGTATIYSCTAPNSSHIHIRIPN